MYKDEGAAVDFNQSWLCGTVGKSFDEDDIERMKD
jgi:hypothetical protein